MNSTSQAPQIPEEWKTGEEFDLLGPCNGVHNFAGLQRPEGEEALAGAWFDRPIDALAAAEDFMAAGFAVRMISQAHFRVRWEASA